MALSERLRALGVHVELARRLGHHPVCVRPLLRGQIPALWVEHEASPGFRAALVSNIPSCFDGFHGTSATINCESNGRRDSVSERIREHLEGLSSAY